MVGVLLANACLNRIENFGHQSEKNKLKGPPIYSTKQSYQIPKCLSPEINSIFQNQAHKSN